MLTDPQNPLHSEVIARRSSLKERVLNLMRDPSLITRQQDILLADRYDNFLSLYFYSPLQGRKYHVVPLGCNFSEEDRHRLFCYERNWEDEGYNESAPVIEMKDGRQVECGILNLDDLGDSERTEIEKGFYEVQRIMAEENATIEA